jgi:hypothetical protein
VVVESPHSTRHSDFSQAGLLKTFALLLLLYATFMEPAIPHADGHLTDDGNLTEDDLLVGTVASTFGSGRPHVARTREERMANADHLRAVAEARAQQSRIAEYRRLMERCLAEDVSSDEETYLLNRMRVLQKTKTNNKLKTLNL